MSSARSNLPSRSPAEVTGLPGPEWGDPVAVERANNPPPTPRDATKATEEQRELQRELEHQDDDPDAPASFQDHTKVADET